MPPCCAGKDCRLKSTPVQAATQAGTDGKDTEHICPVCEKALHGKLCGVYNGDKQTPKHGFTCHKCYRQHGNQAYTRRQWLLLRPFSKTKGTTTSKKKAAAKPSASPKKRKRAPPATATPPVVEQPKEKRKRKSPASTKTLTKEFWYRICSLYTNHHSHMSRAAFLRDPVSGIQVSGNLSDQQVFGRKLKEYAAGTLQPTSNKRDSDGKFPEVEAKIVQYVKARLQRHKKEKLGITWAGLCQKAKEFALVETDPKYQNFTASSGWMQRLMKRNGITNVNSPWAIHTLQSAQDAMEELKSYAVATGLKEEDVQLLTSFGQKLRQHVVEARETI